MDQHKALPAGVTPRKAYQLKGGDLLMSRASGSPDLIGSVGIVPEINQNLLLCDKVYRLHINRLRMREQFIAIMLRTRQVREHIKLGISGAEGMANNLPTAVVRDCRLPNVPLAEQDILVSAFNEHAASVAAAQSALTQQLELLTERRQALITAAVTGQLDVTTAHGI
ncbi:hypothetical protein [Actinocorallia aurantiaca]